MSNKVSNNRNLQQKVRIYKWNCILVSVISIVCVLTVACSLINPSIAVNLHNFLAGKESYTLTSNIKKYVKNYDLSTYIDKLPNYTNLDLEIEDYSVSDDDIISYEDYYLQAYQTTYNILVGDKIENGDSVIIDYKGTINNEEFEGGSAENYELVIGSGSMIDSFESQIIGHTIDDTFNINVTFPDDYEEDSLQGKDATFNISIKSGTRSISYDHSNITDKFIQNNTNYSTVEEFENYCKEFMMNYNSYYEEQGKQHAIIDYILENCTVNIPDDVLDTECAIYDEQYAKLYLTDGTTLEDIAASKDMSLDEYKADVRTQVQETVTNLAVSLAVANDTGTKLEDGDLSKFIDKLTSGSDYEGKTDEEIFEIYETSLMSGEDYLKRMCLSTKAMNQIMDKENYSIVSTE